MTGTETSASIKMPIIERKITLGNIISLVTLVVAAAGFYWTTTLQLDRHAADLKVIFERADRIENAERQERERIRDDIRSRAERTAEQQGLLIQRTIAVEVELKGVRADLLRLYEAMNRVSARP